MSQDLYKEKYLKYKSKYLSLKNEEGGAFLKSFKDAIKSGDYWLIIPRSVSNILAAHNYYKYLIRDDKGKQQPKLLTVPVLGGQFTKSLEAPAYDDILNMTGKVPNCPSYIIKEGEIVPRRMTDDVPWTLPLSSPFGIQETTETTKSKTTTKLTLQTEKIMLDIKKIMENFNAYKNEEQNLKNRTEYVVIHLRIPIRGTNEYINDDNTQEHPMVAIRSQLEQSIKAIRPVVAPVTK
jgi:hypothetical protein